METISMWLVGSFVVPLALILLFVIFYLARRRKYLLHKNTYKDCQFLGDCWKGYIYARIWQEECRKGPELWWYLFGSKYIDMVNFYSQRCIYELDQLDRFKGEHDVKPYLHRKAFMRQWEEIRAMLFDRETDTHGYSDEKSLFKFKPEFGEDPFGWMTVMIEGKLFELYKKHALQILRTKGYLDFSNFLANNYCESKKYPHNAAYSIIASGKVHEKIMRGNSQEIGERLQHEVKAILGKSKIPKTDAEIKKFQSLLETFVLKGELAGGGYSGTYYVGLSEVRTELCALLEKATVAI